MTQTSNRGCVISLWRTLFLFFRLFPDTEMKKSLLFTTKPKLSQARALSFRKSFVSLQKTFS